MHNQICLSMFEVKFMRETEDGVFYSLIRIIDDIYRKNTEKHGKNHFGMILNLSVNVLNYLSRSGITIRIARVTLSNTN